jgi:hypothetical protein
MLDQSSPWSALPDLIKPSEFQQIIFRGETATGMLWAKTNESAILSFAFAPDWGDGQVQAQFCEMDKVGKIISAEIGIPNLSNPDHVTSHRDLINNYGRTISASSLVYEGDGFVVRIWFNDHDPPHFHVLARRDTSDTLARCSIQTLDFLSGDLSPVLRRRVKDWAGARRERLMEAWVRCRMGKHPFFVEE